MKGSTALLQKFPAEDRTHIYKAVQPPEVSVFWGAQIGEVAHSLRSALDHLAWQLVIAAGNSPNNRTQFPICERYPEKRVFKCLAYPRKKGRLRINGEVPLRALALIEAVQPYHGTDDALRIGAINKLDILTSTGNSLSLPPLYIWVPPTMTATAEVSRWYSQGNRLRTEKS